LTAVVDTAEGRVALDADDHLGETPVWSVAEQALYWVNCEEPPLLRRWHPATGETKSWPMPERIGGFVLRAKGGPAVTIASGVYDLDIDSGALTLRAKSPVDPAVRLHESGCDRSGRLWVGGYDGRLNYENRDARGAALCRLERNRLVPVVTDMGLTNSLAFSPDGRTIYFSDSTERVVRQADLDPATGALSNLRPFIELGDGDYIDGAAVDIEGGYWGAMVMGGEVRRHRPDGTVDRSIKLPFSEPTKPAFGGPDLRTLYITSAKLDIPGHTPTGDNGTLYAVRPGIAGLPEPMFDETL
jgi:sugar lactone lactonase YvrE